MATSETMKMGKTQKATTGQYKTAKLGKAAGLELSETQLDQASGGIIAVLKKGAALLPAVQ